MKKAQFGTDIRVDVTQRVLGLMFQYQCRYVLDTMYDFSTQDEVTITIPTSNITVESKAQEVLANLNKVGQKIAQATGRMYGNKLVVGMDMRSWLESLPSTYFTPAKYDEKDMNHRENLASLVLTKYSMIRIAIHLPAS